MDREVAEWERGGERDIRNRLERVAASSPLTLCTRDPFFINICQIIQFAHLSCLCVVATSECACSVRVV